MTMRRTRARRIVDRLTSAVLVVVALALAGLAIRRELTDARLGAHSLAPTTEVEQWDEILAASRVIREGDSSVQMVEFLDLECPACRAWHRAQLRRLDTLLGTGTYRLSIVHFPLESHPMARLAAISAECAAVDDRFAPFVESVLERQHDLGEVSFEQLARGAGVLDTARFRQCRENSRSAAARVDSGIVLGDALGISATPTILLNGKRYSGPPRAEQLARDIRLARRSRSSH
jgi:protein-disulfide isomerase